MPSGPKKRKAAKRKASNTIPSNSLPPSTIPLQVINGLDSRTEKQANNKVVVDKREEKKRFSKLPEIYHNMEESQEVESRDEGKTVVTHNDGILKREAESARQLLLHENSGAVDQICDDKKKREAESARQLLLHENSGTVDQISDDKNMSLSVGLDGKEHRVQKGEEFLTSENSEKEEKLLEPDLSSVKHVSAEFSEYVEAPVHYSGYSRMDDLEPKAYKIAITEEERTIPLSDDSGCVCVAPTVFGKLPKSIKESKAPSSDDFNEVPSTVTAVVLKGNMDLLKLASEENEESIPRALDLVPKRMDETTLTSLDENSRDTPGAAYVREKDIDDAKFLAPGRTPGESSLAVENEPKENTGGSVVETQNASLPSIALQNPESPENQPIIPVTQRRVERTSWMSCCGLFDLLRGSDR